MIRVFIGTGLAILVSSAAFGQSTETHPAFDIADVHVSAHSSNPSMRGGFIHGGRYELRTATMVDLIRTAYGVDAANVVGGPAWLDTDRFDVIAKAPANSTPETLKLMLQALLADRFKLAIHNDTKALPGYALTAGKHPLIKQSDGSGESGCQAQPSEYAPHINGALSCHSVTMVAFAEVLRTWPAAPMRSYLADNPVQDQTGLTGAWDFNFKWTGRGALANAGSDGISLFDAIDKQLGLKLELKSVPAPVIVVDSVNQRPTDNLPGVTQSLPVIPTEFEVADIRPSMPGTTEGSGRIQPGGRIDLHGLTMKDLIKIAWNIDDDDDDMIVGGPKWLDTDRFDIVAKASSAVSANGQQMQIDEDALSQMLRALLVDRFKITTHTDLQPVTVYALVAVKPKLKKADPSNRSGCKYAGAAPGAQASALLRTYICQNTTMALFADSLHGLDPGYTPHPVVDMTGMKGGWDFTLTASGSRVFRRGSEANQASASGIAAASDPNGAISLFEALEKQLGLKLELQKHPMPIVVIDHIEEKPTDN